MVSCENITSKAECHASRCLLHIVLCILMQVVPESQLSLGHSEKNVLPAQSLPVQVK